MTEVIEELTWLTTRNTAARHWLMGKGVGPKFHRVRSQQARGGGVAGNATICWDRGYIPLGLVSQPTPPAAGRILRNSAPARETPRGACFSEAESQCVPK